MLTGGCAYKKFDFRETDLGFVLEKFFGAFSGLRMSVVHGSRKNKMKDNVFDSGISAFDFLHQHQSNFVMEICTGRLEEGEERGDQLIEWHAFR